MDALQPIFYPSWRGVTSNSMLPEEDLKNASYEQLYDLFYVLRREMVFRLSSKTDMMRTGAYDMSDYSITDENRTYPLFELDMTINELSKMSMETLLTIIGIDSLNKDCLNHKRPEVLSRINSSEAFEKWFNEGGDIWCFSPYYDNKIALSLLGKTTGGGKYIFPYLKPLFGIYKVLSYHIVPNKSKVSIFTDEPETFILDNNVWESRLKDGYFYASVRRISIPPEYDDRMQREYPE